LLIFISLVVSPRKPRGEKKSTKNKLLFGDVGDGRCGLVGGRMEILMSKTLFFDDCIFGHWFLPGATKT
jgi:hypothetical protein